MSPVALAECLGRFIARAVHFSCCGVGAVSFFFFFNKCKWRHGLIVEEGKKNVFDIIKYFGLLSPTSPSDAILCVDAGV